MFDFAAPQLFELFVNRMATIIAFDLSRYLIAAGVMTVLLFIFHKWAKVRRIQKRKATRKDFRREFLSSVRACFIFALVSFLTLGGRELGLVELHLETYSAITIVWQSVLMILAHDTYFYWMHRALHHRKLFKATHLRHHKSRTPTPWAAYSFSSAEAFAEAIFVPLFLLAASTLGMAYAALTIFVFLWFMIIRNVIGHMGHELYPAGWVDNPLLSWWNTTTHHDLHHSAGNHNFGLYFRWWDQWMGTEHPRYADEFRKNAQPLNLSKLKQLFPRRGAEQISVLVMALFAASMTLGWPTALMVLPLA